MTQENDLEVWRAELDKLDEHLLDVLLKRIDCCVQIARYKREHNIPMMQPQRINLVQERAARYAVEHGMNAEFLHRLYELIIAETCRVEDLVMGNVSAE
jgi:chorismate mutase-like protein